MLRVLEVCIKQISVAISELITEFLHCICGYESTSCFTFIMNCGGDFTSVLISFGADTVNIAVCFAAAILLLESILSQCSLSGIKAIFDRSLVAIEAVFHPAIDSIKAITYTISNTAKLAIYILVVETFEQVGTSYCALRCTVISTAKKPAIAT